MVRKKRSVKRKLGGSIKGFWLIILVVILVFLVLGWIILDSVSESKSEYVESNSNGKTLEGVALYSYTWDLFLADYDLDMKEIFFYLAELVLVIIILLIIWMFVDEHNKHEIDDTDRINIDINRG